MKNRKAIAVMAAIGVIMIALTSYALAVQLNLDSDNVERIGGTGQVNVLSPENDNTINSVTFTVDTDPTSSTFGDVISVDVTWDPAENGDYRVIVILYDNGGTVVGYGTATPTGLTAGSTTTTTVTLTDPASPEEIYKVEVIIEGGNPFT